MNSKAFILTYVTVFLVATLMVGCASTNQIVSQAKGPIPADSARILLTRETHNTDSSYVITDNEINIGQIGPGGQLEWDRIAGPMKLTARLLIRCRVNFIKVILLLQRKSVLARKELSLRGALGLWRTFSGTETCIRHTYCL